MWDARALQVRDPQLLTVLVFPQRLELWITACRADAFAAKLREIRTDFYRYTPHLLRCQVHSELVRAARLERARVSPSGFEPDTSANSEHAREFSRLIDVHVCGLSPTASGIGSHLTSGIPMPG